MHVVVRDGIRMIQHPLLIMLAPNDSPAMVELANRVVRNKRERLRAAIEARDFWLVSNLHEKPYRLEALLDHFSDDHHFADQDFVSNLASIYMSSENVFEQPLEWARVFEAVEEAGKAMHQEDRHEKLYFGSREDRLVLEQLPEMLSVFRGRLVSQDPDHPAHLPVDAVELQAQLQSGELGMAALGYSWTLQEDQAHWFAERSNLLRGESGLSGLSACVIRARISKQAVFSYLGGRGEEEILIADPKGLQLVAIETLVQAPRRRQTP